MDVCWSCIKGRHSLCNGKDDPPPMGYGRACQCPIPHDGVSNRCPLWDQHNEVYIDPGPEREEA